VATFFGRVTILVSSGDPVPADESEVAVEERLEREALRSDTKINRDLKLAEVLFLDGDGNIKSEMKPGFIVERLTFDKLGGIELVLSNRCSISITISSCVADSWFFYCPDGKIVSYYKSQLSLHSR